MNSIPYRNVPHILPLRPIDLISNFHLKPPLDTMFGREKNSKGTSGLQGLYSAFGFSKGYNFFLCMFPLLQ